jgi:hypothetical protein
MAPAAAGAGGSSGSGGSSSGSTGASFGGGSGIVPAGILTAGAWDDNRNFSFFTSYLQSNQGQGDYGLVPITSNEVEAAHAVLAPGAKSTLDVSLVIDTTGSMGDEIAYLQSEFNELISVIQAKHPYAQQHWSLVLYKDVVDVYIARWYDFRTNPGDLQAKLLEASAGGGGDEPESPEVAIDVANRLSWRQDDATARVMFWVTDAPHHPEKAQQMADVLRASRDRKIHIYPVAASGASPAAEAVMRSAAQLTGGRYVFLTDDSGVGNAHEIPHIPCYYVTKLGQAILRMVDIEYTGVYHEPDPSEILRTGGSPTNGVCSIPTGPVQIY